MNPLHYPSLELCKKLTEIGFPKTYMKMHGNEKYGFEPCTQGSFLSSLTGSVGKTYDYRCPSVMEMLDVIPKEYTFELFSTYWNENDHGTPDYPYDGESHPLYQLKVYDVDECEIIKKLLIGSRYRNNIPDAIASKILWLVENKYITFNNEK